MPEVLIDLVRRAADAAPARPVVIDRGRSLSYAQCLARSEELASGLVARSIERAGVLVADVGELLALLCASSLVGTELCVYGEALDPRTVAARADELGHAVLLSDRPLELGGGVEVVSVEALTGLPGQPPDAASESPVLILTTGTTFRPKAARHDWRRLIAGVAAREDAGPPARWLLAYNVSQFGGLQVMIHALATRATLVVPPSRQPYDVLRTMREHEVTHASGTPTFWRMIVALLDEPSAASLPLQQITLGGEIVPGPLLERLGRLFPAAHISQVYGATEFGTAVSVRDRRDGLPLSVLDRDDDAAVQLRIVEGELQAWSRVGMVGYHAEGDAEADWRPTGDLVEVRGDRIHFVGRTSDVINVGGVKVHPATVEEVVSAVKGVKLVRAYGRSNPVTGEIVALEVVPDSSEDADGLDAAIRAACSSLPPAAQPRLVRFVSSLPTTGEKIRRHARTGS